MSLRAIVVEHGTTCHQLVVSKLALMKSILMMYKLMYITVNMKIKYVVKGIRELAVKLLDECVVESRVR